MQRCKDKVREKEKEKGKGKGWLELVACLLASKREITKSRASDRACIFGALFLLFFSFSQRCWLMLNMRH